MIARYTIHFKQPVRMLDHWPIDVLGARMSVIADDDMVHALRFTFTGQPTSLAPKWTPVGASGQPPNITIDDPLHAKLLQQVRNGFSFIQALFPVKVAFDRTEAEYEAETAREKGEITIPQFSYMAVGERPLTLTYDFFSRAMMAAEKNYDERYRLFSSLVGYGDEAQSNLRYIDAFRYYFLLLDSLFGDGQFKRAGLAKALKSETKLVKAVELAMADFSEDLTRRETSTGKFLRESPSPDAVIDHLIDRRGHYFHGNRKKAESWNPDDQDEARDLSRLCAMICLNLSDEFSAPMFAEELGARHFAEATKSGAIMELTVDYTYFDDDGGQPKQNRLNINVPGTKITRKLATSITQNFVQNFIESQPTSSLAHAICREAKSGKPVFEIRFPKDLP